MNEYVNLIIDVKLWHKHLAKWKFAKLIADKRILSYLLLTWDYFQFMSYPKIFFLTKFAQVHLVVLVSLFLLHCFLLTDNAFLSIVFTALPNLNSFALVPSFSLLMFLLVSFCDCYKLAFYIQFKHTP